MPYAPRFSYFIASGETPVTQNSALWRQPLPLSRDFSGEKAAISLRHGEYFHTIRTYLENDGCGILCRALNRRLQQNVKSQDIREIRICLEKHGEFYHPARIEVLAGPQTISFVLNVAVSETGIETIKEE